MFIPWRGEACRNIKAWIVALPSEGDRFQINLRMHLARQLLRETKKSVMDVALDIGYTNPAISHSSSAEKPASP
jgi:AraC-like DNA-binding protein